METQIWAEGRWVDNTFKSYYVVWKLKRYILRIIPLFMFKSYYVVWKLNTRETVTRQFKSLNRTM